MLNHSRSISTPRAQRFLVKQATTPLEKPKTKSIFSVEKLHQIEQFKKDPLKLQSYQLCGDPEFKRYYLQNLKLAKQNYETPQNRDSLISQKKEEKKMQMKQTPSNNFHKFLSKTQQNVLNRETSSLQKFAEVKEKWQKIDGYLKFHILRSSTITFGSARKLYAHENPQKNELIDNNIPEYWKKSLRNNDKKLKSYLQGHKFKQEKAEQMLQTLKGQNKIEESIPKIDLKRLQNIFQKGRTFSLKANRVSMQDGYQTMQSFHKNQLKTFNEKLMQKSLHNFRHKRLSVTQNRENSIHIIHPFTVPQIQNMNQSQRKSFCFCQNLENFKKMDQQIYKRNYDKKSRWILQGPQVFN